jgi:hypothetical protein
MKCVCRVTPGTTKITAGEPHENARKPSPGSFSLNRLEYFGDKHDLRSYVYWRPDFARAVLRANHQIAKKNTVTAMINRAYPGASPTDRKTRM